jgi:hypothetical protein
MADMNRLAAFSSKYPAVGDWSLLGDCGFAFEIDGNLPCLRIIPA